MKESTMATIKDIAAKLNEGCSYSEVSKALGISKSTVSKVHILSLDFKAQPATVS